MDEYDELDDGELAAALRDRADALTVDVVDTDAAFAVVRRRARTPRRWRGAAGGALAAAAAVVGVLIVTSVAGDDAVVRTPGDGAGRPRRRPHSPTADDRVDHDGRRRRSSPGTDVARTDDAGGAPPCPDERRCRHRAAERRRRAPIDARPAADQLGDDDGPTTAPAARSPCAWQAGRSPSPATRRRRRATACAIDDNGPDRVRVRFELDDQRSEIRVDLEDGQLVPEIIES